MSERWLSLFLGAVCGVLIAFLLLPATAAAPAWPADDAHLRDNAITVPIDIVTATTTELVAAESGTKYVILSFFLQSEGSQGVILKSGTTAKTGDLAFSTGDTYEMSREMYPINCARSEAINLTTSGAVQINGWLTYVER